MRSSHGANAAKSLSARGLPDVLRVADQLGKRGVFVGGDAGGLVVQAAHFAHFGRLLRVEAAGLGLAQQRGQAAACQKAVAHLGQRAQRLPAAGIALPGRGGGVVKVDGVLGVAQRKQLPLDVAQRLHGFVHGDRFLS